MPRYNYVCPSCGREYYEVRTPSEPLYFDTCACGTKYDFVSEE